MLAGTIWLVAVAAAGATDGGELTRGKAAPASMSALTFGPDGILFLGDGKGGQVWAVDVGMGKPRESREGINVRDVESRIGALLGTTADQVMVHDLAVHPSSQEVYLSVSRGRSAWNSAWSLPNDVADATLLLRLTSDGEFHEVSLESVRHDRVALPNPVDAGKMHPWKEGISLRADTITDMAYADGTLYVAGLSNEEFASTMWKIPYPFTSGITATTLEIFHGAHGEYETHAPIRTFLPYRLEDEPHLLAAYLCTPMVTFKLSDLQAGKHVKGRTVAEFGFGNYPLDMVAYRKEGKDLLLIANSQLPFLIVDPKSIETFHGQIDSEVSGYTAGIPFEMRSGTGVQQLAPLNDEFILALQRLPGGSLSLVSYPVERF